jgi:hypothetical protein
VDLVIYTGYDIVSCTGLVSVLKDYCQSIYLNTCLSMFPLWLSSTQKIAMTG